MERGSGLREKLALLIELQKMELAAARIGARKRELPVRMNELEEGFKALCAAVDGEKWRSWKD
jgi:hypothetical protein